MFIKTSLGKLFFWMWQLAQSVTSWMPTQILMTMHCNQLTIINVHTKIFDKSTIPVCCAWQFCKLRQSSPNYSKLWGLANFQKNYQSIRTDHLFQMVWCRWNRTPKSNCLSLAVLSGAAVHCHFGVHLTIISFTTTKTHGYDQAFEFAFGLLLSTILLILRFAWIPRRTTCSRQTTNDLCDRSKLLIRFDSLNPVQFVHNIGVAFHSDSLFNQTYPPHTTHKHAEVHKHTRVEYGKFSVNWSG